LRDTQTIAEPSDPPLALLHPVELALGSGERTGRWSNQDIWQVLTAARDGDAARLRALLAQDRSLAEAQFWYTPPLHFAVREGHTEAARLLIEASASVTHRRGLYGTESLMQIAAERGHEAVAELLREALAARHPAGGSASALHAAVTASDRAEVERLLAEDPRLVTTGDEVGRPPLHFAVATGRRDLVDLLLDAGAEIDAAAPSADDRFGGDSFRPVALALWHHAYWRQRNDYALARHLLTRGARSTITIAAALGDEERVAELLARDRSLADEPESCGKRPLSAAAERGHAAIVERLLAAGADPNLPEGDACPRGYALWAAVHFGHREIAARLLAAGADPNADVDSSGTPTETAQNEELRALLERHGGRVRLATLAYHGQAAAVLTALDAEPHRFDPATTALTLAYAASEGHQELLRELLARGLRLPPVVTVCQSYLWHRRDLARLLLEAGMDPDLPNWQQMRPLHHLAQHGDVETARLFLDYGADPSAIDEEYRSTPLGWAARCGQREFVRFLLGHEAVRREAAVHHPPAAAP
jgi:ankyrin repeat protein